MFRRQVYFVVFCMVAAMAALAYWWNVDWWAYYHRTGQGWVPKFKVPIWWQVTQSTFVGFLAAGIALSAVIVVDQVLRWIWRNKGGL